MKKVLILVLAVLIAAGLTVAGCKKGEEVKPVPTAGQKKEKKSTKTKKKDSSKKSTATQKKSSKKKEGPPESMM